MNPEPFRGPLQLSGNHVPPPPTQAGQCGCEDGYTEVMTSDGVLDQCTVIPVLEIPTAGDSKTDVKTIRAPLDPTLSAGHAPGRAGRTWFLQPFGQGRPPLDPGPVSLWGGGHMGLCSAIDSPVHKGDGGSLGPWKSNTWLSSC